MDKEDLGHKTKLEESFTYLSLSEFNYFYCLFLTSYMNGGLPRVSKPSLQQEH